MENGETNGRSPKIATKPFRLRPEFRRFVERFAQHDDRSTPLSTPEQAGPIDTAAKLNSAE
jgi:hypothetical protein